MQNLIVIANGVRRSPFRGFNQEIASLARNDKFEYMGVCKGPNNDLSAELTRLGNRGVRKAQKENRRLGIPNVYFKYGPVYYQLPNGEITTENPEKLSKA